MTCTVSRYGIYFDKHYGYDRFLIWVYVNIFCVTKCCHVISQIDEDTSLYSVVIFTMMNNGSDRIRSAKTEERKRLYAAVKTFGLGYISNSRVAEH